jgi:hypothetical protein
MTWALGGGLALATLAIAHRWDWALFVGAVGVVARTVRVEVWGEPALTASVREKPPGARRWRGMVVNGILTVLFAVVVVLVVWAVVGG